MKRISLLILMVFMLSPLVVGCAGLRAPTDMSLKDKAGWYKEKVADAKIVSIRIKEVKTTIGIMKRWPDDHSKWTPKQLKDYDSLLQDIEWLLRARLTLSEKDAVDEILGDKELTFWLKGSTLDKGSKEA